MAADPARTVESSQATATTSESSPKKTKEVSSSSPPSSVRNANGGPKKASGSSSKKAKRSFWSSLKATLFPCIPSDPSKSAHDISPDQIEPRTIAIEHPARTPTATVQGDSEPTKTDASGHEKEKGASLSEKEKPSQRVASTTAGPTNADSTSPATPPTPTTPTDAQANAGASGAHPSSKRIPAPITTAQQEADAKLGVPHTPTHTLLPVEETEGVTSGAVVPPGATGAETQLLQVPQAQTSTITSDSDDGSFTDDIDGDHEEQGKAVEHEFEDEDDEEERLILQGGTGIPIGPDGKPQPLLPPVAPMHKGRKCLVLDLDETLLHSSFKLIPQADYVVPVEIEWQWHNVYVIKRPGVDQFLKKMGELYEIVIFTASLSKYADPVLDKLDVHKVVAHRLFRESCYNHKGNYVKDLSRLGRPAEDMIILDNSPASYIFHPNNAVPVSSWFNDPHDTELTDLCPFLADLMHVDDVRGVLDGGL